MIDEGDKVVAYIEAYISSHDGTGVANQVSLLLCLLGVNSNKNHVYGVVTCRIFQLKVL